MLNYTHELEYSEQFDTDNGEVIAFFKITRQQVYDFLKISALSDNFKKLRIGAVNQIFFDAQLFDDSLTSHREFIKHAYIQLECQTTGMLHISLHEKDGEKIGSSYWKTDDFFADELREDFNVFLADSSECKYFLFGEIVSEYANNGVDATFETAQSDDSLIWDVTKFDVTDNPFELLEAANGWENYCQIPRKLYYDLLYLNS